MEQHAAADFRTEENAGVSRRRLPFALAGNALLRIAGSAGGVLAGLYLASLANAGARFDAALAGTLGAVSFGGELVFSLPAGMLSDAFAPRILMTAGALAGAVATQLFGMSGWVGIFFLSRTLEGLGAAAGVPPLLAHITDVTGADPAWRARVMGYFELSLLAGLALGGLAGAWLWEAFHTAAFAAVAAVYAVCAGLLFYGTAGGRRRKHQDPLTGLRRALAEPSLRRLAPVWLCVNSIAGLWLGPALIFLLTHRSRSGQFLAGVFAGQPERVGWMLAGYSAIFGAGVLAWGFLIPRFPIRGVLRTGLAAMTAVCLGLWLLNHSGGRSDAARFAICAATALCIAVESGFTPAALSLLAAVAGAREGRGAAMGIYSALLSAGAIGGSLLAGALGKWFAVDGLIYGTLAMAFLAMALLRRLDPREVVDARA